VSDDGGEVLIDEALEARAIAVERNGPGRTTDTGAERSSDERGRDRDGHEGRTHGGLLGGEILIREPGTRIPWRIVPPSHPCTPPRDIGSASCGKYLDM
jgi:hypothetical protein